MSNIERLIRAAAPSADKRFLASLKDADAIAARYGVEGDQVLATFLANCHHETMGFRKFEENMNYTAKRIRQVWPSRPEAAKFANNPQGLANSVYANRMGNGPASSGDGWRFRGGGGLHHTGAAEYKRVAKRTGMTPDQVRDPANAAAIIAAAASYMQDRKVIPIAARGDDEGSTRAINGGLIGHQDRMVLKRRYIGAIQGTAVKKQRTRAETAVVQLRSGGAAAGGAASSTGTSVAVAPPEPVKAPASDWAPVAVLVGVGVVCSIVAGVLISKARKTFKRLDDERQLRAELLASQP